MNVPAYPEFRPLSFEDKPLFDEAFLKDPPVISEFTFTNLYAWRCAYCFEVATLDALLILRCEKKRQKAFLSPIGRNDKKRAILTILMDTRLPFIRVPEEVAKLFEGDGRVTVKEDEANADYLYLLRDLVELPGRKYDGKRNLIKKFKSSQEYQVVTFNTETISECLNFAEAWCVVKNCESVEGLAQEKEALKEMVACFKRSSFFSLGIRIGTRLSAIALAEALNRHTVVMHILKADAAVAGLYQTMMHEMLSGLKEEFLYVNLEQDLGLEGLRKSKRSYYPVSMVPKCTLTAAVEQP